MVSALTKACCGASVLLFSVLVKCGFDHFPGTGIINTIGISAVITLIVLIGVLDHIDARQCQQENAARHTEDLPRINLASLAAHDGRLSPTVYCCVKGRVYDVTTSGNFSLGGSYNFLCGADATVGMAKMSTDNEHINDMNFDRLTQGEWEIVDGWVNYMDSKYRCVAMLQEFDVWLAESTSSDVRRSSACNSEDMTKKLQDLQQVCAPSLPNQ
eukprot:TRINITY_DN49945_c0_g1_i1.p1 TRINITY_DN49945_c0_g1~~TRINITY_DN49945_c0_g1_i1.p1  ORF type:complete len:222 (-),score=29.40 TRINITY_DN49945_c0_g1_i1:354-995(-)